MAELLIRVEADSMAAAVSALLSTRDNHLFRNPMAKLLANAVENQAPAISARMDEIVRNLIVGPEFEQKIRTIFKDAMCGEAERMGRNAARAIVNSKSSS